jgi:hypothetical protein
MEEAVDIVFKDLLGIKDGEVDACVVRKKLKTLVSELRAQTIAFNPRHPCSGRCTPHLLA